MADLLKDCLLRTREVSAQWKYLGVLLKVEKYRLDEIEKNYPTDVATCRIEMLHAWITDNPQSTTKVLDDAVKQILTTSHDSRSNHVADCIQLDGTIEEKIKHLKADFAAIVIETRGHLEELYSNVENAATWLNEILRGNEDEPLVVEESAPDYSKLFRQLQKKWSFTRPDLLQQLVDELTIVSLKKRMQAYTERYDAFCHSFPINKETKAKSVQFEPRDPRQPCLVIIFESISKYFNIEVFLTDVFKIYKRYLRVHKIDLDSVQRVTVQFAASMEPHLQACIDQGKETARRHRVTDIHIEPQTETQQLTATQDNTTHTEEKTQKEVETLAIDCETIENKSKMTETRILRKRVNSKPNGVIKNKKSKTKKITNGEMIPCYD